LKISLSHILIIFTGLIVSTVIGDIATGQTTNKELLEELMKTNPQAAMQYKNSLSSYKSKLSSTENDTIVLSDTTDSIPDTIAVVAHKSLYQKLFNAEIIHPDSLLTDLQIFGQNIFANKDQIVLSSFQSTNVPNTYPIGPEDEIIISLWGRLNEEHRLTVDRTGAINIPRIGPVQVGGQTFIHVQKTLKAKLEAIEGVSAAVEMGKLRTIPVFIIGEVKNPGLFTVNALTNVTNALFLAGGPNSMGSLRNVEWRRGKTLIKKIDFYDFLLNGKNSSFFRLQPNDVLFVPIVKSMAAVVGNVRRSAIYEIHKKDNLSDVIALAGGISPAGWNNRIQIERFTNNSYQSIMDITLEPGGKLPEEKILDGDIIKIFPIVNYNENTVFLEGNVKRPGKYAYKPDLRLSDILTSYDALLPETYFKYAVVQRFEPPSYLATIIPFNLQSVLEDLHSSENLILQPGDKIIIYHSDYFEPDRSVSIEGSITSPGKYKLLENMKLRDLILQAGGLSEDASTIRGELYRRRYEGENVTTEKIDFNIDDVMRDHLDSNFPLQRFDHVFIRKRKGWEEERSVILQGEFVYPGKYILFEGETLAELITRAGGFTADAYLEASLLTRPSVKTLEKKRQEEYIRQLERDMVQTSASMATNERASQTISFILEQQIKLAEELKDVDPIGRVVIDLTNRSNFEQFIVEDGDILIVPKNTNTVSVIGEVFNPATFTYNTNNPDSKFYLSQTGGFKATADHKSIYIVRANGSVYTDTQRRVLRQELMPGDVIVVPKKVDFGKGFASFMRTLDVIEKILGISAATTQTMVNFRMIENL